jgi:hypothetical protein
VRLTEEAHWDEWNGRRAAAAIVWLTLTALAGIFIFFIAGFESATFKGQPPTHDELRTSAGLTLLAGGILCSGPYGIGFLRKTWQPKLIAALLFIPFAGASLYYFVKA